MTINYILENMLEIDARTFIVEVVTPAGVKRSHGSWYEDDILKYSGVVFDEITITEKTITFTKF